MPPTPYHQPQTPPNLSVLNTFTAALSDLSALKPTLLTLRNNYLSLELELRNLAAENLQSRARIENLTRKCERLEKERNGMARECASLFAARLERQNENFMQDLARSSGIEFDEVVALDSPIWVCGGAAAAGRDGVVGEVWKREGRFVWVRREDGGMGRIDGVAGVTKERVVGGWEQWKKDIGRRAVDKKEGLRARLVEKRESWGERWREEMARLRGEDDLEGSM